MQFEDRITIGTRPELIFSIYAAVDKWHAWDPDTKSASIAGPFATGTRGRLAPAHGREVAIELSSVIPNQCFTVTGGIPMFTMVFEHELTPLGDSMTQVVHRATLSGALTLLLGRSVGAQIREGLPKTLASLKRYAEAAASDTTIVSVRKR
jgi:hypothetical protein